MAEIEIKRIGRAVAEIRVVGTAPLIINCFSEKAKQIMLDKQQGRKSVKEPRDPEKNFQAARYVMEGGSGDGVPAVSFKAAIVGAARHFDKSVSMAYLKQACFVIGEGPEMLVRIDPGIPRMREDTVRNETGVADLRYRPEYWPWACILKVVYLPTSLSLESVIALVDAGGIGGVGEWRPASKKSATGMYGTFTVDDAYEIKETRA